MVKDFEVSKLKEPQLFTISIVSDLNQNDSFIMESLKRYFGYSDEKAVGVATELKTNGKYKFGTYYEDVAIALANILMVSAKKNNQCISVSVENLISGKQVDLYENINIKNFLFSPDLQDLSLRAEQIALEKKNLVLTPEHFLFAWTFSQSFIDLYNKFGGEIQELRTYLNKYFYKNRMPLKNIKRVCESHQLQVLKDEAFLLAAHHKTQEVDSTDFFAGLFCLYKIFDSYALYAIKNTCKNAEGFLIAATVELIKYSNADSITDIDSVLSFLNQKNINLVVPKPRKTTNSTQNVKLDFVKKLTGLTDVMPVIGREDVVNRTIEILCRKTKNNPIHVGEPGVGKTSVVMKLAQMIDSGNVPKQLQNATIYSLNVSDIVAGSIYHGELEGRFKKLMEQLSKEVNPILYIDEIHMVIGSGSNKSNDIANMLKPYLVDSKIKFIGATTTDEYRRYILSDKAFARRVQDVIVEEPTIEEAFMILQGLKSSYESFHNVTYTNEALQSAVTLSAKYITERYLPDKAIDLMDEAGAYASTHSVHTVDKTLIEDILAKTCKIPSETVKETEIDKLRSLSTILKEKVFGQDAAIDSMTQMIKISRAGLNDNNKPIGSFLAVGPTGVGKTEIAKALSETMGIPLLRYDMSEYMDETSANKLIGSSAGYVGYEDGGLLTNAIRKTPNCVLLLDEIEKANPKIFDMLLQIMDNATLTDNKGNKADFRNVVLIMTSNAGASQMGKTSVGFNKTTIQSEAMVSAVNKTFKPEFRNRLSSVLLFNSMNEEMAKKIAVRQLELFIQKMEKVQVSYSDDVILKLSQTAHTEYGGREIKRNIEQFIKPLFVDELLFGNLKNGGNCEICIDNNAFILKFN